MKKVFIAGLTFLIVGCAGLVKVGSISDAYESYQEKDYDETLRLIRLAENVGETNPEEKAELTYLKAQTYEGMGQYETAETLYQYLKDQHKDSQYGYFATKRLEKEQK